MNANEQKTLYVAFNPTTLAVFDSIHLSPHATTTHYLQVVHVDRMTTDNARDIPSCLRGNACQLYTAGRPIVPSQMRRMQTAFSDQSFCPLAMSALWSNAHHPRYDVTTECINNTSRDEKFGLKNRCEFNCFKSWIKIAKTSYLIGMCQYGTAFHVYESVLNSSINQRSHACIREAAGDSGAFSGCNSSRDISLPNRFTTHRFIAVGWHRKSTDWRSWMPALVAVWANHRPRCMRARVRSPYGLRLKCIPCGRAAY